MWWAVLALPGMPSLGGPGPEVVADLAPEAALVGSSLAPATVVLEDATTLFFGPHGLWRSDGQTDGTELHVPMAGWWSRFTYQDSEGVLLPDGRVLFSGYRPGVGAELWVYEAGEARFLADLWPGPPGSRPRDFSLVGAGAFFVADGPRDGTDVYFLHGSSWERVLSAEGESLSLRVAPTQDAAWALDPYRGRLWQLVPNQPPREHALDALSNESFLNSDGQNAFVIVADSAGRSLRVFSLGVSGPEPALAFDLPEATLRVQSIFALGPRRWLVVGDDPTGRLQLLHLSEEGLRVLHTDGGDGSSRLLRTGPRTFAVAESRGLRLIRDGRLEATSSAADYWVVAAARDQYGLVVVGIDLDAGERPWAILRPGRGPIASGPTAEGEVTGLIDAGDRLYITRGRPRGGLYLIEEAGIVHLTDLRSRTTADFDPNFPRVLGDRIFVRGVGSLRIAHTTGEVNTTRLEATGVALGVAGEGREARMLVEHSRCPQGRKCIFAYDRFGASSLLNVPAAVSEAGSFSTLAHQGRVFIRTWDELWVSDGLSLTPLGRPTGRSTAPMPFAPLGQGIIVRQSGGDLYYTDGTPGRYTPLPTTGGQGWLAFGRRLLALHDGRLEILEADGQLEVLLSDRVWSRNGSAVRRGFKVAAQTRAYLVDSAGLIVTDGTPRGTHALSLPDSEPLTEAAPIGDRILFPAYDERVGDELWISDGTSGGTHLLADTNPGPASGRPSGLTAIDGKVLFMATTGRFGREVFISDGTPAGTRRLFDAVPGPVGMGQPQYPGQEWFAAAGGRIYLTGDHPEMGRELWAFDRGLLSAPPPDLPPASPLADATDGCSCRSATGSRRGLGSVLFVMAIVLLAGIRPRTNGTGPRFRWTRRAAPQGAPPPAMHRES